MLLALWVAMSLAVPTPVPATSQQQLQQRTPPRDTAAEKTGSGVIRGKITSADTGRGLRRAQVRISAPELAEGKSTSTNAQGLYEVRDLPAGRYTITVTRSGYLPMQHGQRRPGEPAKPLQLEEKQTLERIDFALPRAGVISGRVTDETGDAFAGVAVWPMQVQYYRGRRRLVPAGGSARTDDTGAYRILAVTPGDYVVMARIRETWTIEGPPVQTLSYLPTYYPGTGNVAEARRVRVGIGQEVAAIDIGMVPGRAISISGTALRTDGLPMTGSVALTEEVSGPTMAAMTMAGSAKIAGDGSWKLRDVPPGEYQIDASSPADGDRPAESASAVVLAGDVDIEGLVLMAEAVGTLAGRVITDDGSPLPPALQKGRVSARRLVEGRAPYQGGDSGRILADGSFELTGVRGPSLVRVAPLPAGWAIKSIDVGGRDYVDAPLELRGQRVDRANIVVTNRFPEVVASVVDQKGNAADGTVVLFPTDAAKWIEESGAARGVRPDQAGTVRFSAVRPGEYLLIALEYVQPWQWNDPEFLETLRERATKLTLGDGEVERVTLTIKK